MSIFAKADCGFDDKREDGKARFMRVFVDDGGSTFEDVREASFQYRFRLTKLDDDSEMFLHDINLCLCLMRSQFIS